MINSYISYNPLYLQVKDILLKRIVDGIYAQGESIPSELKLAADFGTSVSTIRQAVSILVSDGYLVRKQGKGTYVSVRKTKLTFACWVVESKRGLEIINNVIALFEEKHPSVEVELIPTTYPETRKTLLKMITSGNAPDVAQIVSHWTSFFASMGALEPLNGYLSRENLDRRLRDKDLLAGTYMDKLYSVSWGLCPVALVANLNVLRDVGLDSIDFQITLDDFFSLCTMISAAFSGSEKYCYGLCKSEDEVDFLRIYTFLQAFRGGFVNDREEVIFNSRENLEGFTWLREFIKHTKIFISDMYTIRRRFARGDIAFLSDGPWVKYILEEITGERFDRNFKVLLNPVRNADRSYSWGYNHALAICSQSKNKLYAAQFIDELTVDEKISNFYYEAVGHLPVQERFMNGIRYDTDFFHAYKKQLDNTRVINAQNAMFEKAMVLCQDAVQKILFEDADIERELDEKQYYLKMLYYD
jgi:ABC-type glycerol-3-phosphate transport system substrate-binding protein